MTSQAAPAAVVPAEALQDSETAHRIWENATRSGLGAAQRNKLAPAIRCRFCFSHLFPTSSYLLRELPLLMPLALHHLYIILPGSELGLYDSSKITGRTNEIGHKIGYKKNAQMRSSYQKNMQPISCAIPWAYRSRQ